MKRADKYKFILCHFKKAMPHVTTELDFGSMFQLLVATILSAQCTDKRVNIVTAQLFRHYPDAKSMASASEDEILEYIRSVSYPNAKAAHLSAMAKMLIEKFDGEVPDSMDELIKLPGVGRKTANVLLAVGFGKPAMPVDTHVFRVSHRLGLVPGIADTPISVEKALIKNIPAEYLADAHHWLLLHGRYTCTSRHPHCSQCPFKEICPGKIN